MKTGLAKALVAMLVLPTLIMVSGLYIFVRSTISEEVTGLLEVRLNQKAARLGQWLDGLENEIRGIASFSQLGSILQLRERPGADRTTDEELQKLFAEVRRIYGDCYLEFLVYDTTGFLVYPTDRRNSDARNTRVLAALLREKAVVVDMTVDSASAPLSLWLCAPVGVAGKPWLGILAAHLNPQMIARLFSDPSMYASEKAYLVDSHRRVITPLHNPPEQSLETLPESEGVSLALAGRTGIHRYRDYRGVEVIGAYTYLPSPGWGLVVEQDYDEAFAGLIRLRRNILLLLGVLTAVCIVFSLVTASWIVHRLERRDRRMAERSEQLIAADKLATAGVMAASVAHEINNPLTTINVLIHNLHEETPPDEPQRMDLHIALDEISKIKNIILRFLDFAQPQEPEFSEINVNDVVHRICRLTRHQAAAKNIKIVERLADDVPLVFADPSQIGQAFLNILLNAIEATPVRGTIELSSSFTAGQSVSVRMFNTGPELKAELYEKIFEPFYSTKAQGTGLGLSIARMIVERHGGKVTAAAVPGKGTEFVITLNVENQGASRG